MLRSLVPQFLKYVSVGAVATVAHYAALILLVESSLARPAVGALIGATLGALVSYGMNRRYTFVSDRSHAEAGPRFAIIALVGVGLTYGLMHLLADRMGLHYLVAQILTTGVVLVWTFIANRFWTFSR